MKRLSSPVLLFGITGLVILLWAFLSSIGSSTSLGPFKTISELSLADSALDIPIHDTYYVIAWRGAWFFLSILFLAFASAYLIYERLTGRRADKTLSAVHFVCTLLLPMVFGPIQLLTVSVSAPRRYYDYSSFQMFDNAIDLNTLLTAFLVLALLGQLIFVLNLVWFAKRPATHPR